MRVLILVVEPGCLVLK